MFEGLEMISHYCISDEEMEKYPDLQTTLFSALL